MKLMSEYIFDFENILSILTKFRPVLDNKIIIVKQALLDLLGNEDSSNAFATAHDDLQMVGAEFFL